MALMSSIFRLIWVLAVTSLACSAMRAQVDAIEEGFNPGDGQWIGIDRVPATSRDTGYAWSGYKAGLHGLGILDGKASGIGVCLDISGHGRGYGNVNAWTVFGDQHVRDCKSIVFEWGQSSASYNMNVQALIRDETGAWFVSHDSTSDIAGTRQGIDAQKTAWTRLLAAPVIGKELVFGRDASPDLSKVTGGGLVTIGTGSGHQTRLDTLIFSSETWEVPQQQKMVRGKPSPAQMAYHDDEVMMLLCFDPQTWQGGDYDNHSTPLTDINPSKLSTDQWCEVAASFGAQRIIHVAKHTGNFLWWSSDLNKYGVKHTPYKQGRGDVVAELAASCHQHGLKYGIYVYAHRTDEGTYRRELTEVLSKDVFKRNGPVCEVWFDGGMRWDIMDILGKHAPDAIYFGGPADHMRARWPGSESGYSPEPAWQTVRKRPGFGMYTGMHSDPDGDMWLPMEMDTPLLDHKWYWAPDTDHMIKSVAHLMTIYYRSVGRGGVLLLSGTPDTSGLIPPKHVQRYKEFGAAIRRLYDGIKGETQGEGRTIELTFDRQQAVNHIITMEDIRHGHVVRRYVIDGWVDGAWQQLVEGDAIGHKKIDLVDTVVVEKLRFRAIEAVDMPRIRSFAAYDAPVYRHSAVGHSDEWQAVIDWKVVLGQRTAIHDIDLTQHIPMPGLYEVILKQHPHTGSIHLDEVVTVMAGVEEPDKIETLPGIPWGHKWRLTRTAAVDATDLGKTVLRIKGKFPSTADNSVLLSIRRVR